MSIPTAANSSRFVCRPSINSRTFPLSTHLDSRNFCRSSVCAYAPFSVYSFSMAFQWSLTVVLDHMRIKVKSGIFWFNKDLADHSSFSHCVSAVLYSSGVRPVADVIIVLAAIIAGVPGIGRLASPSKWPQKPLASTASRKCISKMAQFVPLLSSLGTELDRESDREVAVTVVISGRLLFRV
jgi:hypothetical protein